MDSFRKQRNRCLQYTYGDQLSDIVRDEHSRRMTERQFPVARRPGFIKQYDKKARVDAEGYIYHQNLEPICVARDRDEQTESDCYLSYLRMLMTSTTVYHCMQTSLRIM